MDNKFKTKRYDLYWLEKQKHELAELKRVVEEAGLSEKLIAFPKSQMDYHEDAINWFEVRDIIVDSSEDVKKPKTVNVVPFGKGIVEATVEVETKLSKSRKQKPVKEISMGMDLED